MYLLRITFQSFQKPNQIKQKLILLKKRYKLKNIRINGLFQIKQKKKIFTLLKSTHVNKKSREHFIYKKYSLKTEIKFKKFLQLINFLILIKKSFSENLLITTKIIKKN